MKSATDVKSNLNGTIYNNSPITVIGIGGCGCTIVNAIYEQNIKGVNCVAFDTNLQTLKSSNLPIKIRLKTALVTGLAINADTKINYEAVTNQIDKVVTKSTKIVFLIAGYGGETSTLALPLIGEIIRQKGIFTAAFVITPFAFEGEKRNQFAFDSAQKLKYQVDDFLLLDNNIVREKYGNIRTKSSLAKMDEIIIKTIEAVSGILDKNEQFEDISKIPISEIGFREYQKVFGNVV